ncbi:zinc finger protein 614-like isoform X3 [Teleopsis dalmanni]|uniref:zinc finger protein 614-like isoform X3 n=1 Tax=Teleopsis dalmanni TaxID=139649 RepID=UPI0018CCE188|nr:zinc finger protein 614-like isoform X3 [Teleopsis dalmanni]
MAKDKWSKLETEELISIYRNYPLLYNIKHEDYIKPSKKEAALNEIVSQIKWIKPDATCEVIKKKIKTLKDQYGVEQRNILKKSGMSTAALYTPKLWCFKQLSFLSHSSDESVCRSNINVNIGNENIEIIQPSISAGQLSNLAEIQKPKKKKNKLDTFLNQAAQSCQLVHDLKTSVEKTAASKSASFCKYMQTELDKLDETFDEAQDDIIAILQRYKLKYTSSRLNDMMKKQTVCATCNKEFDSVNALSSHILEMHKDHSETYHNANTAPKLELNTSDLSPTNIYSIDDSRENSIKNITSDDDNSLLSVKYEDHSPLETDVIENRYIADEGHNEKHTILKNKKIKVETEATNDLTSIEDGVSTQQFIKKEIMDTNTEQLLLENEMYTVTTLENECTKMETKTTPENLFEKVGGDKDLFENVVAAQEFIKDEGPETSTEHFLLENEMYTVITIENETIKMQPDTTRSESPCSTIIDDRNSFEDGIPKTKINSKQFLTKNKENTVIKKNNGSIGRKAQATAPKTDENVFTCTKCDQSFTIKESLDHHMRQHTGEKSFTCTDCNQCFTRKQGLDIHIRRHNGVKPYNCSECDKSFAIKRELNQHMRRHTGEKPYICTECDKCFAVKHALIRHMKKHTGEKPHICSECNKTFTRKQELDIHMRRHTGEKPFSCTECNKNFAVKQALTRHMKRHTGEKPYTCTECNRCFSIKESLKSHMRLHTGEKPYSCTDISVYITYLKR